MSILVYLSLYVEKNRELQISDDAVHLNGIYMYMS